MFRVTPSLSRALLPAGLAVVLAWTPASAQEPAGAACRDTVVAGRVERGEAFEAPLPSGLVFRLDPEGHPANPPGWTIRVTPADDAGSDFVWVATPPYRFSNARYLDTGYGIGAEAALAWTPRGFRFVATERDRAAAADALGVLLWSGEHTQDQIRAARATMDALPSYPGRLFIEDGETTSDADHPDGVIDRLRFRVELCVP